jgi:hypothetical protein
VACNTLATAALMLSLAPEITSLTPRAPSELAQELSPEGLGLRRTNIHAEHFAAAVTVDADRNAHRDSFSLGF